MEKKINLEFTVEEIGIIEDVLYRELDVLKDEIRSLQCSSKVVNLDTKQIIAISNILAQLKK